MDTYGVGYGILSSGVFTQAVTKNGESSIYGAFSLHYLDANISWAHDNRNLRYHIKGAYTLLPRESEDKAVSITQWRLSFLLGFEPKKRKREFIITSGLGVLGTISKGSGGVQVLNNGGGTSVFYRPDNTSQSKLLMLEVGFTHYIAKNLNYSIDALVNGLFGARRNLNIYLSFNYFWDHGYKRRIKKAQMQDELSDEGEFIAGKKKKKKVKKRRRKRKTKSRRKRVRQRSDEGV